MTAPLLRDSDGYYTIAGTRYPSATTVLRAMAKPALVPAAAWSVTRYACALAEHYATEQADESIALRLREAESEIARSYEAEWDRARDLGTRAHDMIPMLAAGVLEVGALPEELAGLAFGAAAFLRDHDVRILHSEMLLAGQGYAGTADAIAMVDGRRMLLDWKTHPEKRKARTYPEHRLQLAAYRYAECMVPLTGPMEPMQEVEACAIVHLWPGGYRMDELDITRVDFAAFCAVLHVWTWQNTEREEANARRKAARELRSSSPKRRARKPKAGAASVDHGAGCAGETDVLPGGGATA